MEVKNYLFAIDMDGTLLNEKKVIPYRTRRYLRKLQKKGHIIVLASGRPFRSLKKYYELIGLQTPIICYNGALCFNPHDQHFKSAHFILPQKVVKDIYHDCRGVIDNIMCETNDKVWEAEYDEVLHRLFEPDKMNIIYGDINDNLNDDPWTLLMRCKDDEGCEEVINAAVAKHPGFEIRFWFKARHCEVFNIQVSKGRCLKDIASYYHLPDHNIVAIGDATNDLEMIQMAGIGVAMTNGMDEVKEISTLVTKKDNNHQGVRKVIKQIIKNQL